MEALRCSQCGGAINPRTMKCEYCGTQYKNENISGFGNPIVRIVQEQQGVHVIGAELMLDPFVASKLRSDRGEEFLMNTVRDDLINKIAKEILQHTVLYTDFDIDKNKLRYSAKIRVLDRDYKF